MNIVRRWTITLCKPGANPALDGKTTLPAQDHSICEAAMGKENAAAEAAVSHGLSRLRN
jgi:hypothetical protein